VWTDEPDAGTVIYRNDGKTADYYDGREWRTVKRRDLALDSEISALIIRGG
jgi:hypothetical protein